MAAEQDYKSTHTGSQLDSALDKVLNPDTTPESGSTNLITSGGVKAALEAQKNSDFDIMSNSSADLDVADKDGKILVRFANGHVKTKNFDSSAVYTKSQVDALVSSGGGSSSDSTKQDKLVSGVNIKTINGTSLLGSGNINITGTGSAESTGKTLKILIFGNSYTMDALSCARSLMRELVGAHNIVWGYMYASNSSLYNHLQYLADGTVKPYYKKGTQIDNVSTSKTMTAMIQDEEWDWIVFQQISSSSNSESTYFPHIDKLIQRCNELATKPVRFAYMHAQDNANTDHGVARFNGQASACKSLLTKSCIEEIIPCGTALQNIRTLDTLNTYGDRLNQGTGAANGVGYHLQTGIGQFVESAAFVQWVIRQLGLTTSILGSKIVPDTTSYYSHTRGDTICGITENNTKICRMAALAAVRNPNEITDMSTYINEITPE